MLQGHLHRFLICCANPRHSKSIRKLCRQNLNKYFFIRPANHMFSTILSLIYKTEKPILFLRSSIVSINSQRMLNDRFNGGFIYFLFVSTSDMFLTILSSIPKTEKLILFLQSLIISIYSQKWFNNCIKGVASPTDTQNRKAHTFPSKLNSFYLLPKTV